MLLLFGYFVVAFVASIEGHGYGGGGGFQHSGGFSSGSSGALSGSPYQGLGFPGGSAASFSGSFGDGSLGLNNQIRNEGTVGTDFKLNGGIKKILESFRHGVSGGSGHAGHFSEHGGSGFGGSFAGSGAGNSFAGAFGAPFGFSAGFRPDQKFEGEYQGEVVIGKPGHKHSEHGAAGTDVVTIRPGGHGVGIHESSGGDRIQAGISTGFGGLASSSGSNSGSGNVLNIGDGGHENEAEVSGDHGAQVSQTEAPGTTLSPSGGSGYIQSNEEHGPGNSFGGGFVQESYQEEKNSSLSADLGDSDNEQQQGEDGKFGPSWTLDLGAGAVIHGGGNGNGQENNEGQEQRPGFDVSGTSDSGSIGSLEVNIRPSEQKHEQVKPESSITLEGSIVDGSFGLPGFGFDLHGTGSKETKFEVSKPGTSGSSLVGGIIQPSLEGPGIGFNIHGANRPGSNGGSLVGGVVDGSFGGPGVGFGIHGESGQDNKHEHRGPAIGGLVESTFNVNTERPGTDFNIQSHIKPAVSGHSESEGVSHLEVNIGGPGSGSNIHGGGSHENKHESAGLGVSGPVAGTIGGPVVGSIIHGSSHENKHGSHAIGGGNNIRPSFGQGNKLVHGGLPVGAQGNFGFGNGFGNGFPNGNGLNFGYVGNFNGYNGPNYFPQGGYGYTGGPISSSEFGVYPSSTTAPILTNSFSAYPSSTLPSSGLISSGGTILKPIGGILIRHHHGSKDGKGQGGPGAIVSGISGNKEGQTVIGIHGNKQRPGEGSGINIGVGGTEAGINLNIQGSGGHGNKHELVAEGPGAGHNGIPLVSGSHYGQKIDFGRPLTNGFGGSYFGGSFPESSTNFGGPLQNGFLVGNNQGPAVNFGINQEHKFELGGAEGSNRYPVGSTGAPVANFGSHEQKFEYGGTTGSSRYPVGSIAAPVANFGNHAQKFEYGGAEGSNRYPVGSTAAPVANFGSHEQKFEYGGTEGSSRYPVGSTAAPVANFGSLVGHEQKYVHGAPGSKIGFTVEPAVNIGIQKGSINEQNRHETRPGGLVVGSVLNGNIGKPGIEFNVQHGSILGDVHGHDGLVIPAQQNFNIGRPTTTDYKYSAGGSGHHASGSNVPNLAFGSSGGTTVRPANINSFFSGSTPRPVIDGFFDGIGSSSEQLGGKGPTLIPSSLGVSGSEFVFGSGGIDGFFDGVGSSTGQPALVRPDSTGVSSHSSGITVKPEFGGGINGFFSGIGNSREQKRPALIHSEAGVGGSSAIKVVSGGATVKPGFGSGIDGIFSGIGSTTEQITGKEPAISRPGYTGEGSSVQFGIGSGGSIVKPSLNARIDGFFDGIGSSTEQFSGKGPALTRPGYTGEGSSFEFGVGSGGSTVKPSLNARIDGFFDGIGSSTEQFGGKGPALTRPGYTGEGSSFEFGVGSGGSTVKPSFSAGIDGFFDGVGSSAQQVSGKEPAIARPEYTGNGGSLNIGLEGTTLKPGFSTGINGIFNGIGSSTEQVGATVKPGFGSGIDGFSSGIDSSTEQITRKEPAISRPGYTGEGSSVQFGIGSGGSIVKPSLNARIDGFFDGIGSSTEQFGGKGPALTRPGYTGDGSSFDFGIGSGGSTVKPSFSAGIDGFFDGLGSSAEHVSGKEPVIARPEYTGEGGSLNIGLGGTTIKPGFSTEINGIFTGIGSSTEQVGGTRPVLNGVVNEERPINAPERTVTTEEASLIGHEYSGPELHSSIDKSQKQQENDNKDLCGGPNQNINIRLGGSNNCENGIKIGKGEQQGGLKSKGVIVRISPPRFGFDAGFDGSKFSEGNKGFDGSFIGQGGLGGFNGGFDAGFDGTLTNQGGILGQGPIGGGFDSGFDGTKLTGFGTQGFAPGYFNQGGFGNQGSSLQGGFGLDAGFDGSGFGLENGGYKQQLEVLPGGPIGIYRQEVHGVKTDETKKIKGGSEGSQGGSEGGLVAVSNQPGVKGSHGDLVVGIDSQNILPGGPVGVSSQANGDVSFSSHGDVGSSGLHSGIGLGGDISGNIAGIKESLGVLAGGLQGNNGELSQGPLGINGQISFDGVYGSLGGIGGAGLQGSADLQGGSGSFSGIIPAVGSLAENKGLLGLLAGAAQGLKGGISGDLNLQPGIVNSQTNLGLQGGVALEANKGGFSSTASNSASNSASTSAEENSDLIAKLPEGGEINGKFSKNSAASSSSSSSSSSFVSFSKDLTPRH